MDICNNHSGLPSTKWPDVCRYEAFLSFRGGDVRGGFVEFLYEGLDDSGIIAFIDHRGIEIGEHIMPKILQVIGHTQICIPIFSKDFASSKSCLKEVEKMVECDRTIMPIFYDVSPSVVGEQKESYQQSFHDHEAKGVPLTTINNWKEALQIVSRRRGWELEKFQDRQRELINEVVSTVCRLLRKDDLYVTSHLVGMDQPVQEVMRKLGVGYENGEVIKGQTVTGKRVVEISGLPGIGKSTLAAVVYNKIHHLFEGKSFLKEVEQTRLLSLQEDLVGGLPKRAYTFKSPVEGTRFIKYKFGDLRVLIILDDVSDFKQVNSLAGDLSWFGPGSRIIVISRRSNLVDDCNLVLVTSTSSSSTFNSCDDIVVEKYELKQMNDDHAFQLFCSVLREKHLKRNSPLWHVKLFWLLEEFLWLLRWLVHFYVESP
ncbi:TMV resistance protein N-like [Eucalyptus grandis]|uniref:TMV resistance protein N-like n=1 Tax=Eucalyptus grandis TaxID=71139 RepID=UPI00192EA883|nr:TMV resistance protein N-like [Eucalyptus grandis]